MHDTALKICERFFAQYWKETYSVIVELGSYDVNGSLRKFQPSGSLWVGLDMEPGPSVDVCIKPGAPLPLRSESADVVLASSVFEHDEAFWQTFEELCRITVTGGFIYLSAPSNGVYHRYPQDCWRFYPDAARALEKWVRSKGLEITLIESFVADRERDIWNDFVAIFKKGPVGDFGAADFIHPQISCRNVLRVGDTSVLHHKEATQDMDLLRDRVSAVAALRESEGLDLAELLLLERDLDRIRRVGNSGSPRRRLFTTHGTVLYIDPASGELRHGAIGQSPENAFFVSSGATGRILHETATALQQTICLPHGSHVMDSSAGGNDPKQPTSFEATRIRRHWFALKAEGRFLCAEADGRVTLSREVCGAWESFLISDVIFGTAT
jgi:SAM-dependent methyltransferase